MKSNKLLLELLFEPGEYTCFGREPTDTRVYSAHNPPAGAEFLCINALDPEQDTCPTESYHKSDVPRRADGNVVSFRNFLLELDNVPITAQIDLVTSKIPVSSIVFSGNKSYHFILSLQEPLKDIAQYRAYARALHDLIPQADKSTKNPSRFSRMPGVRREDTGLWQTLEYCGDRLPLSALPEPVPYREISEPPKNVVYVTQQLANVLSVGVDEYIAGHFGGRNQFFFWLGKRLSELGVSRAEKKQRVDLFYNRLQNKRGFGIVEAYHAARVKF